MKYCFQEYVQAVKIFMEETTKNNSPTLSLDKEYYLEIGSSWELLFGKLYEWLSECVSCVVYKLMLIFQKTLYPYLII